MASPVGQVGDLAISMTVLATNVLVGSNFDYFIGVTNYGPSTSSNAMVVDTLPLGVTLMTNSQPGSVTRSGVNVFWNVGTLATNAGAQLTLTVRPNTNSLGTTIVNYAVVSSLATPDLNPADDFASVTNYVIGNVPALPLLSGSFVSTNGTFQLTVNGLWGQEYIVQASTNLFNWLPVYTNPPPFVSPFTFIDSGASNYPDRFYRVVPGP
jgi:uncharacterized repeat protein (TIGR01451 family)